MDNPLLTVLSNPEFSLPMPLLDDIKNPYLIQIQEKLKAILIKLEGFDEECYGTNDKESVLQRVANFQNSLISVIKLILMVILQKRLGSLRIP